MALIELRERGVDPAARSLLHAPIDERWNPLEEARRRPVDGEQLTIAVVAPPWFEIPPKAYGGIESICYWLVEGLRARGHRVILVAAGRNHTSAEFIGTYAEPPSDRLGNLFPELLHTARAARALEDADVDVIHDHTAAGPLAAIGRRVPTVVTAHGPVDGEIGDYYRSLGDAVGLVAISNAQRRLAPDLRWLETVYNAIPVERYPFRDVKEDYVLFLGRTSPEKGVHVAVDAARAAGFPLVIAAKCSEPSERQYFESEVKPRLGRAAEYVGEVDDKEKKELLARARCLLMPVQWEEPFGIVMIEALACGTPVVALRRGSIPEIVTHGVTGFVCQDPVDLPRAVQESDLLEPSECRRDAEHRFDVDVMVSGYESVYERVLEMHGRSRWDREVLQSVGPWSGLNVAERARDLRYGGL